MTVFSVVHIIVSDITPVSGAISYVADSLSFSQNPIEVYEGLEIDIRKENNMNRKTTFPIALMLFVLLWGAFGFAAGPSQAQSVSFQETPIVVDTPAVSTTLVVPVVTQLVPVTGTTDPSPMMWIFFGLIALLGVVFLVALLAGSGAHRHDGPPPPP